MASTIEKLMKKKKKSSGGKQSESLMENGLVNDRGLSNNAKNFVDINGLNLESLGYLVSNVNSDTVEEYRLIKRRLLRNLDQNTREMKSLSNIFLVTSAMEGDGKTFTSINLALSLAMEVDKTVLFIDSDVLRSGASKTFQINSDKGFIDLLEGDKLDFSELVYKTNIPNLSILPSGKARMHTTELFSSEKMKMIYEELSRRYPDRIIIIDSPPILQTTESQALANALYNIIFVVSSGHTPMSAIRDALELLDKDKNISFLLNKVRQASSRKYYYGQGA